MSSSIFPRLVVALLLCACGGSEPDISFRITRSDPGLNVAIYVHRPGEAIGQPRLVFTEGDSGNSREVGFYLSDDTGDMAVALLLSGSTTLCRAFTVPLASPPSEMSIDLPTGELKCEGCSAVESCSTP